MEQTPWYRSIAGIVLTSILVPPLGLVLLWTHPKADGAKKAFGSVGIVALMGLYAFLLFGPGGFVSRPETEAHYAELERHRTEQRKSLEQSPVLETPEAAGTDSAANANASTTAGSPAATSVAKNYWTSLRGPGLQGRYDEMPINTRWSAEGLPLLWKQPVGGGFASFVVADGLAFTTEQRRRQEVAAAYDLNTGREVWVHAWDAEFADSQGGDGPRATPAWDEGRLYAVGALGDLRCLEARTGKLIWSRKVLAENGADNVTWGVSASPLIVDNKVIVLPGGASGKSVVAYDKTNGRPIWRALDDKQAYTTPMLVTLAGKRQILVVSAQRAMGLEPDSGALLWSYPWVTDFAVNSAQPLVIGENRFFISAGYGHGAAVVEVYPAENGFGARPIWQNINMKNKISSSVFHEGHIYGLDEGILACLDAATGERKWKGGRYGHGQLILASGHLVITTEQGELALVKATPDQHVELARFPAIEGKTWNHPAIAGGRLLVRNETKMACFDLRLN